MEYRMLGHSGVLVSPLCLETMNFGNSTRYHIIKACEDSLQRLQTDHIDLYQLHRPPLTHPQDETLRAFDDLIHAGKVRYLVAPRIQPGW